MKCKTIVLLLLAFVLSNALSAYAQWQNVAPNLLGHLDEYGSMTFKDGVVWAGLFNLYFSLDSGKSWQKSPLPIPGHVYDIEFYDASTGLVATNTGAFITRDQGATWTGVGQVGQSYIAAGFGPTSNDLFLTQTNTATVNTSTDGGQQWTNYSFASFGAMTRMLKSGALASLGLLSGTGHAEISISTDFGQTWNIQPSYTKFDCYNFVADPCDGNRIYVVNEEVYVQTDGFAQLYTSSDVGATWSLGAPHVVRYYNASMAVTPNALYMGTCADGIQRSTDRGSTWKNIGGPSAPPDTRDLCAIDDNILLAADSNGSIFRTMNSGGSPVTSKDVPLAFSNPFVQTLRANSCAEVDTSIEAIVTSCSSTIAKLKDVSITGSSNFFLIGDPNIGQNFINSEPIHVGYAGLGTRSDTAVLHISYTVGSVVHDTMIALTAKGFAMQGVSSFPDGTLQALPSDPVTIKVAAHLSPALAVNLLTVHSITYRLTYSGSLIDMSNSMATSLVTPRQGWVIGSATVTPGGLTVTENNVNLEKLGDSLYLGNAKFTALSSNTRSTTVYLEQLDLQLDTGVVHLCVGGEGDYLAHVTVITNAVTEATAVLPEVNLYPVPSGRGGTLRLELNSTTAIVAELQLYDLLGRSVGSLSKINVRQGKNEIALNAPQNAGVYYLRMSNASNAWSVTKKLVVR